MIASGEINTKDKVLFFTNRGKYGYIPVHLIEEAKWKDLGVHISNYIRLDDNERIVAAYGVHKFTPTIQIVMVSKMGMIKRTPLSQFEVSRANKTMVCMKLGELDELIEVCLSASEKDDVYLASFDGLGLQYNVEQVPESGLKTKGVKAMNLAARDHMASMLVNEDVQQIVVVLQEGMMKRMHAYEIVSANRPAKGNRMYKLVRSHPKKVDRLLNANRNYTFVSEDKVELKPTDLSLMAATATYSTPFGKIEHCEWVNDLVMISEGKWKPKKEEFKQGGLFDNA